MVFGLEIYVVLEPTLKHVPNGGHLGHVTDTAGEIIFCETEQSQQNKNVTRRFQSQCKRRTS